MRTNIVNYQSGLYLKMCDLLEIIKKRLNENRFFLQFSPHCGKSSRVDKTEIVFGQNPTCDEVSGWRQQDRGSLLLKGIRASKSARKLGF